MKKTRLVLASLTCAVCALLGLFAVACNNEPEATTYKVTFDVQGHGTAPAQLSDLESGSKIEKPEDPSADGYTFVGWYKEDSCATEWKFDIDTVVEDTTLYAKWDEILYTLTYDVQGKGTAPSAVTGLKYNSKVEAPTAPTVENYALEGWYKESDCKNKWNFETDTVKNNLTLYANWVDVFKVTYDAKGHGTAPEAVKNLLAGDKLEEPEAPAEEGYAFEGWYKDEEFKAEWDFDTDTVTENTTLYAYWKQIHEITAEESLSITVSDHEYFVVKADGTYQFTVNRPTDEGNTDTTYLVDGVEKQKQSNLYVYLKKGRHTVKCTGAKFDLNAHVYSYDMPFDETGTYIGGEYEFIIASTGIYNGVKEGSVTARLKKANGNPDSVFVDSVENGFYIVSVYSISYRLKLNLGLDGVTSIELYEQDNEGNWSETPVTLEKALKAKEVAVDLTATEAGVEYDLEPESTFQYVYFNAVAVKDKWILFEGFAPGTEFWWTDINDGRTGNKAQQINITDGFQIYIESEYYDYILVVPADSKNPKVTFTAKLSEEPKGLTAENPFKITEKTTVMDNIRSGSMYYLTYDLEQGGDYSISVSKTVNGGGTSYLMYYTVNGVEYGYNSKTWKWLGGVTNANPYAQVNLVKGVNSIVVTTGNYDSNFTVTVAPLVFNVATGTYKGTVENKTYVFDINAENNKASLTLTADGTDYTLAENADLSCDDYGVYTFATVAAEGVAGAGTASFKVNKDGKLEVTAPDAFTAEPYKEALPLSEGTYKYSDSFGTYKFIIKSENGAYSGSFTDPGGTYTGPITKNGAKYLFAGVDGTWTMDIDFEVLEDGSLLMNVMGTEYTLTQGAAEHVQLVPGTYVGTDDNDVIFTLVITQQGPYWEVDYKIDSDNMGTKLELTFDEATETYSFTYEPYGAGFGSYDVTFTVTADAEGNPQLNVVDGEFVFTATAGAEEVDYSGRYRGGVSSDGQNYVYYYLDVDFKTNTVTYTRGDEVLADGVTFMLLGEKYAFQYGDNNTAVTFTVDDFYGQTILRVEDGTPPYIAQSMER